MSKRKSTKTDINIEKIRSDIQAKSNHRIDRDKYFYKLPVKEQYQQIKDSKKVNLVDGATSDDFEQKLKDKLFEQEIKAKLQEIEDNEESEYFANSKSLPVNN